ncbi:ABC transporter ATP-binding protein [Promicromonospora sp. MEB111]|uniref:ABC transporter ATP-binding protein n=1 Tax=Promicromonospora sp. MEB111 TaxID=3040301 RepID=UPI00254EAAEA|nr:ABC transporter ATP-binding protein [Promicromonospora sp. MEB111]
MPPTDERSNRSDPSSDPSSPPGDERSTFASIRRLYPYVRPALPRLVGGLVASLGASLMALAIPRVLQWVTDGPLTAGAREHDWTGLAWSVVLVALLGAGEAGLILLRRTLVMFPGTRVEAVMRMALFKHLQDLPVAFHDRWPGGQLLSRIMGDLGLLRRWLVFGILQLVVSFVTIVVGVGLLVATGGWLGIIFLCGAIPVTILAFRFSRKYRKISRLSQDQSGDLATTVEESVHGIRVLKAFGRGPDALDSFTDQASELRETEIRKATTDAGLTTALRVIPEVTQAVALVVGVYLVAQGDMTLGALVAFFTTTAVINGPVVDLGMTLSMTLNARTAVDRFFEVIETVNPLTDPTRPAEPAPAQGGGGGHVAFRNVTFRYDDAERPVLDQVDLELPPGTTTALVGLTGSGKSTLAMLAPRLFDVTAGVVEVDGVDVRDMTRAQVRERVAVAFEDPTLFSASVRDNVLLGVSDDLPEAEREALMTQALDVAQAQFVLDLPDGVGTRIGEEGMSLSGGQRQRLALARAIAARPRVLVLDDPLSALDVTTEEAVTARLRDVLRDTTSLIIAHRPSTVALADRVAVLQGGRITAVGTHHDLLAGDPHYRYIISSLEEDYEAHEPEGTEPRRTESRNAEPTSQEALS